MKNEKPTFKTREFTELEKELLFEPPMPRNNYCGIIKYHQSTRVNSFEELWELSKNFTVGRLEGYPIYFIKRKKTWLHNHRYVKIRTSLCGNWETFTKKILSLKTHLFTL